MHVQQIIPITFLLLMVNLFGETSGGSKGKRKQPKWKDLLIHHKNWSGYYNYNDNRFMCSMYVHSVQYDRNGGALVSFTSGNTEIDMTGYSDDDRIVIFKEMHIWNKSGHFNGQSHLVFTGAFVKDSGFYKFQGNVSSKEMPKYGMVTFIPEVESPAKSKPERRGVGLAMAIGIPLFLGAVVFTLAAFIVVWAVRKGYLRHVPWMYKSFSNPKKERPDVEMKEEEKDTQPVSVEGAETTAVHI